MKKTLIAASVAGAFLSTSAMAANVEMYGLINTGLSYSHSDTDQGTKTDKFSMENGQEFGSHWGLRGSEDLGNGLKLGFVLESGIESDTGNLDTKQGGRLFGREAQMTFSGSFGALSFGRMPIFGSVLGANGLFRAIEPLFANYTTGFSTSNATASMWTRVDNAISYKTPTFAGFTAYAMYSFQNDSVAGTTKGSTEGKSSTDRYASVALRYLNDRFEAVFVVDTTNWGYKETLAGYEHEGENLDDGYTYTLGGNYTFDCGLKVIAFGQYFENQFINSAARAGVAKDGILAATGATKPTQGYGFVDGWGASVGVHYPVLGGTAKLAANYRDMSNTKGYDFERWTVEAAYDYALSKRTALYAITGYSQEKVEKNGSGKTPNGCEVSVGVVHRF